MSTVESSRWALHSRVREVLGEKEGDILMEHLPPAGWSHLVTKDDLSLATGSLRAEMAEIRAELKQDMAHLRIDMERGFRRQTWKMITAMGASQAMSVAIMAAMINSLR